MTCDICGKPPESCICPLCPVCGERGSILCYATHGLVLTPEQGSAMVEDFEALEIYKHADLLVGQIRPILAGKSVELQGAVITDLLAIWLHGHRIPGDKSQTDALRNTVFQVQVNHVMDLVDFYDDVDEDDEAPDPAPAH